VRSKGLPTEVFRWEINLVFSIKWSTGLQRWLGSWRFSFLVSPFIINIVSMHLDLLTSVSILHGSGCQVDDVKVAKSGIVFRYHVSK
jgi:hypothetical protein